jgi:hypothetical protein
MAPCSLQRGKGVAQIHLGTKIIKLLKGEGKGQSGEAGRGEG